MKKILHSFLAIVIVVAGCGGRPANPVPVYRPGDEKRGCAGLFAEMAQIEADMQRILPKTDKTGSNILCGVAGAFVIVPWFFMDFEGADKIEFDAYRNRHNYLISLAAERECDMTGTTPIPSDEKIKQSAAKISRN